MHCNGCYMSHSLQIHTCLDEHQEMINSSNSWLIEAHTWLTAPCTYTTVKCLSSHVDALQVGTQLTHLFTTALLRKTTQFTLFLVQFPVCLDHFGPISVSITYKGQSIDFHNDSAPNEREIFCYIQLCCCL